MSVAPAPRPAAAEPETRPGLASVIHLPDLSACQPTAKIQPKRRRANIEKFRTNDEEHAELDRRARNAGLSINAYSRLRTLGDPGPRARRRAPVDTTALAQGLVAFNRQHSNYNQAVRALNTLVLFAEEHGSERIAQEVQELRRAIDQLQDQFAAPLAAILEAMRYDRQG